MSGIDEQIASLANRFAGIDIQCRNARSVVGWSGRWRVRVVANKNERDEYRLNTFGDTMADAVSAMLAAVGRVEALRKLDTTD